MTVAEMVIAWLSSHGYDGLRSCDGGCECHLDDLISCTIYPGYRDCIAIKHADPK